MEMIFPKEDLDIYIYIYIFSKEVELYSSPPYLPYLRVVIGILYGLDFRK